MPENIFNQQRINNAYKNNSFYSTDAHSILNTEHHICLFPWKLFFFFFWLFFCLPPTYGVKAAINYICKVLHSVLVLHKSITNEIRTTIITQKNRKYSRKQRAQDRCSQSQGDTEKVELRKVKDLQFSHTVALSQKFQVMQQFITLPKRKRIRLIQKKTSSSQVRQEVSIDPQLFKYFMSVLSLNNHVLKRATRLDPSASRFLQIWAAGG